MRAHAHFHFGAYLRRATKQFGAKSFSTNIGTIPQNMATCCPDAREHAGPVFPPPLGEEETQAQRARARRDKATCLPILSSNGIVTVRLRLKIRRRLTRDAGPKPHIAEKNPRGPYIVGQVAEKDYPTVSYIIYNSILSTV